MRNLWASVLPESRRLPVHQVLFSALCRFVSRIEEKPAVILVSLCLSDRPDESHDTAILQEGEPDPGSVTVWVCVWGSGYLDFVCFQAIYSPYRDRIPLQIVRAEVELSAEERAYLTAVEKGNTSAPSPPFRSVCDDQTLWRLLHKCCKPPCPSLRGLRRRQTRPARGRGLLQHRRELPGPAGAQCAPHRHREREPGEHGALAWPRHPHRRRAALRNQEGGGGCRGAAAVAQEAERGEAGLHVRARACVFAWKQENMAWMCVTVRVPDEEFHSHSS